MIEKGFAALAVMAQSWVSFLAEEHEQKESSEKWASGRAAVGRAFSVLLQQAWLPFMHPSVREQVTLCIYYINQLCFLDFGLIYLFSSSKQWKLSFKDEKR